MSLRQDLRQLTGQEGPKTRGTAAGEIATWAVLIQVVSRSSACVSSPKALFWAHGHWEALGLAILSWDGGDPDLNTHCRLPCGRLVRSNRCPSLLDTIGRERIDPRFHQAGSSAGRTRSQARSRMVISKRPERSPGFCREKASISS